MKQQSCRVFLVKGIIRTQDCIGNRRAGCQAGKLLVDNARERTRGACVQAFGHAAGKLREAAGFDGEFHGQRHLLGVFGLGDCRIHQHGIRTQLHRDGGVAGSAHSGIDDYGGVW